MYRVAVDDDGSRMKQKKTKVVHVCMNFLARRRQGEDEEQEVTNNKKNVKIYLCVCKYGVLFLLKDMLHQ